MKQTTKQAQKKKPYQVELDPKEAELFDKKIKSSCRTGASYLRILVRREIGLDTESSQP